MITFMDIRDRTWFLTVRESFMRTRHCYFCIFLSVKCQIQDIALSLSELILTLNALVGENGTWTVGSIVIITSEDACRKIGGLDIQGKKRGQNK